MLASLVIIYFYLEISIIVWKKLNFLLYLNILLLYLCVHYKKEWIDQANCWPVSILPNLFKSFEKLVYHQYTINLVIFFHQNNVVSVKVTVFHIALWLR